MKERYTLNENELNGGYIADSSLLKRFGEGYEFDGLILKRPDGICKEYKNMPTKNKKYTTHSSALGRIDGLTVPFRELLPHPHMSIEISVDENNSLVISQLLPEDYDYKQQSADEAARIFAKLQGK